MKINEFFREWYDYKSAFVKESSMSSYWQLSQNHLMPFFGEMDAESIDYDVIQDYILKKHNAGSSNKFINDQLVVLKMILKYAEKKKYIDKFSDWENLEFPRENKDKCLAVYDNNDSKKIIEYITANFSFRNIGVLIAVNTGMRIGEVCGLKWSDIDIDSGVVKVSRTVQRIYVGDEKKTKIIIDSAKTSSSNREIPLTPALLKMIKPLMKVVNNDHYILTSNNKPLEPRVLREHYRGLMEEIGMSHIKFHGLRHSFATRCINAGIDIKTISVMLGHSNTSTTLNAYCHPNIEQKKSAINKMAKLLS